MTAPMTPEQIAAKLTEAQVRARPLKRYIITISGYDGHEVIAETAGKARWQTVRAFQEAFGHDGRMSVKEILNRMTTLHMGRAVLAVLDGGK